MIIKSSIFKTPKGSGTFQISHDKEGVNLFRVAINLFDADGFGIATHQFEVPFFKSEVDALAHIISALPPAEIIYSVSSKTQPSWDREIVIAIAPAEGMLPAEVQDYLTQKTNAGEKVPDDIFIIEKF